MAVTPSELVMAAQARPRTTSASITLRGAQIRAGRSPKSPLQVVDLSSLF
jgi:hypothetical protein